MRDIGDLSPCFRFIRSFLGTGGVGVEIGVYRGDNAECVLDYVQPDKYYLVDPWECYEGFKTNQPQEDFDELYAETIRLFSERPVASILRMTSEAGSKVVPDDLDFVYVDGNHSYEFKMLDMECWYPKIRSGGVLCGDDYHIRATQDVVRDFCNKYELSFETSEAVNPHPPEFWIIKP